MPPDDDSPLAGTEVHYLRSERVGDEFKIFVGHCDGTDADPPVVLYLTDANGMFGGAVDLVRYLRLNHMIPPMLVVGIGYRAGGIAETIDRRTRDLTPTRDDDWSRRYAGGGPTGGAPNLLAFVRTELQPWVASTFTIAPDRSTFFGHSFGGLFATYALLTAPDTFAHYAPASPSYWWDAGMAFALEAEYATGHDDLRAKVFVATGAGEDQPGRERALSRLPEEERAKARDMHIDFVADAAKMTSRLRDRGYPGLVIENVVLPEESHNTVPQLALSRALRRFFAAPA